MRSLENELEVTLSAQLSQTYPTLGCNLMCLKTASVRSKHRLHATAACGSLLDCRGRKLDVGFPQSCNPIKRIVLLRLRADVAGRRLGMGCGAVPASPWLLVSFEKRPVCLPNG